ncbi:MAG: tRNA (adenosine(37)-N6)-threonylcarbamoyltransferase complex ATPase subunit type 1 TsaE [Candidatus Eremiobacteraeota bacterium]|nr:tRNA (adenosine(37)-N6)-threonylcarbamoyltransferase complex ATPase subunit type 1 TsaE [Candidatus Eremiobacteraeota bacterium]
MSPKKFVTHNAEETENLGEYLAGFINKGMTLAFYGELGTGKTTLIRGICRGLGINHGVKSPSFVIILPYHGAEFPVYHIDVYRLDSPDELIELGPEEFFTPDNVALVEWAEKVEKILPPDRINIKMKMVPKNPDDREIIIELPYETW